MTKSLDLIKVCKTFLLDCDGVLWRGNEVVKKAVDAVKILREKVGFVTNNSRMTRQQFFNKLQGFGFEPQMCECFCTSFLTGIHLKSIEFKKTVYVVGESGLAEELRLHDIKTEELKNIHEWSPKGASNPDVGAVVVGLDTNFHYSKLAEACFYLRNPDVMFLATNTDAALPSSQGRELPGAGAMIAAVKAASLREPVIVGKPSPKMFDVIKTILDVDPATTCMVGDRIETDIKFGNDCGMKTVLVMSGVTSHQSYQMLERECSKGVESVKHVFSKPTFISETLYDLVLRLQ